MHKTTGVVLAEFTNHPEIGYSRPWSISAKRSLSCAAIHPAKFTSTCFCWPTGSPRIHLLSAVCAHTKTVQASTAPTSKTNIAWRLNMPIWP